MTNARVSPGGYGCLFFGGGLFAAVGIGVGCYLGSIFLAWQAMQGWVETPARIQTAELVAHRGDDSTSYSLSVEYAYEYDGRTYTGTRAGLHGGSDNIGSYHQQKYEELSAYRDSGELFRCYVNPNHPAESILYRDPRWELTGLMGVFAVLFGLVGVMIIGGGVSARRTGLAQAAMRAQWPTCPWMWRKDWAAGLIEYRAGAAAFGVAIMAVLWNGIAFPALYFAYDSGVFSESIIASVIILLFPGVGILLVLGAVRAALQWRKYGSSLFRMAEVPGTIGGALRGVIEVPASVSPENGYQLTLSCINQITTGTGKQRKTSEQVLWKEERTIVHELYVQGTTQTILPVLFGIPFDQADSDDTDSDNVILWRLEVKAATSGVEYEAKFEVPVFKTDASAENFVLDESAVAEYLRPSGANPPIAN